ncbi:MAK10-like protein [Tanacetum coccineum]
MGDANPIRTLGDYSKPSHEGYRNTIELPVRNNVVPLRSDTILLVQNRCSFHGLRSEDPNQHLKDLLRVCEIDRATGGKLHDKNANESWEIIENLAIYDHEGWTQKNSSNRSRLSLHLKAPQKHTSDRRLIELENQVQCLMEAHIAPMQPTQVNKITSLCELCSGPYDTQYYMENPKLAFVEYASSCIDEARGTTFEARVREYMAAHTERMERFENAISKQREEINDKMAEIGEEEKSDKDDVATGDGIEKTNGSDTEIPVKEAETENGAENRIKNEPIKRDEKEEGVEAPNSQPVEYYLKHRINEKLIEGLVDNHRFNDSLLGVRVGKMKGKTYTLSPRGPVYKAILKKKITRKEDIGGNFEIPCNIGGLKRMNALVDQGSDVNGMPLSTYMKLTDETPAETDIRLSLACHSYIYPLGIAEDVLVDVSGFVYLVDIVILDIKEDEKRPFILGTPFLTMANAVIKFDKGTITLKSGKSKISFHMIPESLCKVEKGIKNNIRHISPTMTMNRLVLEWEDRIKLH